MKRRLARAALTACLPALALIGCGGGSSSTGSTSDIIRIDGSSTVFPIAEAVAEEFQRATPGARVTVGISGTGGGFQKFCRGETDISNASRPIKASEIAACAEAGIEYVELPVAYDGIAIVVNPANTWTDEITTDELKTMWEPAAQSATTQWSQIRPGWPDREIHLFGPGVDSGTFDYFTQAIVGEESASRGDFTSSEDDNVLVQGIAGDELALGYFGYAYYEENRERLKLVGVRASTANGDAEAILPSPDTVRDGRYTPLSRPIFVYVRVEATERPEVRQLMTFWLQEGVELVREVGYVPLSEDEYEMTRRRLADRRAGTMFDDSTDSGATLASLLSRDGS